MGRRMKLKTAELGDLEVYVIYAPGGRWEEHWRPLQGTDFDRLATTVPKDLITHALNGWTSPLVKALGIPPVGALKKLPPESRLCALRGKCTFYRPRDCRTDSSKLPWCFEPDGLPPEMRSSAVELIGLWREGVYVLVQVEEQDAGTDK